MEKRLYRNVKNGKIFGVCSGLAEYFGIDPTVVRVAWAIFACFYFAGVIAYIIAVLIIPEKPLGIEE